ncbi:T3SS effector HopA1 family protein [Streptomyces luteireticuli]|uniref:T3SS effector HopA1 family protein n=1 Tax=Streptomyces luteireticuli TaxID=173858 RepID=UPI003556CC32
MDDFPEAASSGTPFSGTAVSRTSISGTLISGTSASGTALSGLGTLLSDVRVDPGARSARVGERHIGADTAGQLRQKLISALYEELHVGNVFAEERPRTYQDPWIEEQLREATPHDTTTVTALPGTDGVVTVDGVRVRVPGAEATGNRVRMPAQRPGLSPGFFLVDGSRGHSASRPLLRLYVHLRTPEEAVRVWGDVLRTLERHEILYRAKVTSSRRLFPRRDGLVVYLGEDAWHAVPLVTNAVSRADIPESPLSSSALAETLAPGIAMAWEPEDTRPGMRGMSFGQHRAAALADALLEHAEGRRDDSLHDCLRAQLLAANIDPESPYRNLSSPQLP